MEGISSSNTQLFNESSSNFMFTTPDDTMTKTGNPLAVPMTSVGIGHEAKEDDVTAAEKEIRRQKDRVRRRNAIQRRKCERQALNWQINELSKHVEELTHITVARTRSSAWRSVAAKHLKELKQLTDDRWTLREKVGQTSCCDPRFSNPTSRSTRPSSTASRKLQNLRQIIGFFLIRQYLVELFTVYQQTDKVFRACAMDSNTPQPAMIKTTREKEFSTEYFQSCAMQLMPFEYDQTCRYLWQLVVLAHRQEDRGLYQVEDPLNTVAVKFRMPCTGTKSIIVHYTIRRYEEENRLVIVWRSLTEGEGVFSGMNSDETGWCVVRPSSNFATCTVVEMCTRVVPKHVGPAAAHEELVNQFTNIVLKSAEEDILQIAIKLDRLLLDEAIGNMV